MFWIEEISLVELGDLLRSVLLLYSINPVFSRLIKCSPAPVAVFF